MTKRKMLILFLSLSYSFLQREYIFGGHPVRPHHHYYRSRKSLIRTLIIRASETRRVVKIEGVRVRNSESLKVSKSKRRGWFDIEPLATSISYIAWYHALEGEVIMRYRTMSITAVMAKELVARLDCQLFCSST